MKRVITLLTLILFVAGQTAEAAVPTLPNSLSKDSLDKIAKEFSSNFTFTNASPPSVFGKKLLPWLGFEVGLVAGFAKSPELDTLVTTEKIDKIPHVGILTNFSFPYGLALESNWIPKKNIKDVNISYTAFAAKWTVNEVFWEWLPVDIAVRGHWAKATVDYAQTINNSTTGNTDARATIELSDKVWGFNASVGYGLFDDLIEPYVGVGFLRGIGEARIIASSPTITILTGLGFTGNQQSADSKHSSAQFFGGVQFNLLVVNLAAEAMRAFGTNNYTAKFSFDF